MCALDQRPLRADRGKVVTDTAAPAHGFGGFGEGAVDARTAVDEFDERDRRRINRLERRIARLEERRQAGADLDAASARDLARALARRVRSKLRGSAGR